MGHEPHEVGILIEREFAARFKVRISRWDWSSAVHQVFRRHDHEAPWRGLPREGECDLRLVGRDLAVWRVVDFHAERLFALYQLGGVRKSKVERRCPWRVD